MSRNRSAGEERPSFSSVQRRACIILIVCLAAVAASAFAAWKIIGMSSAKSNYDPALYPVDTTLGAVLTTTDDAGADYASSTVFVGDQQTVALAAQGQISLDQYVGAEGLSNSDVISKACVNFVDDAQAYTIPQAIAKMKPRRLVVTLGTNDAIAKKTAEAFIQDYRQAAKSMATSYPYCDIIINAVPPVPTGYADAAAVQTLVDQYNQALAKMCEEDGYRFLNSSEGLKAVSGFGEETYFDTASGNWNKQGVNTFMMYLRNHAYTTDDRRPDTNDIPKRAAQAANSGSTSATPSPTPAMFTASYGVEDGKGTLTSNDKSNVTSIETKVAARTTVSVTAVAADGYAFYKWSDGQTSETRYDIITQDISVTAMFNDARVEVALDKGNTTLKPGESLTINATVKLGGKDYDNSQVQWALNDDMQSNGPSYTFAASAGGEYVVKAGLEINGTYQSASITITVDAPATGISVTYPPQMQAGTTTTLVANLSNATGDVVWTCDELTDWRPTGTNVSFTAPLVYDTTNTYHFHVSNNGASQDFSITVAGLSSTGGGATAAPTAPPVTSTDGGLIG